MPNETVCVTVEQLREMWAGLVGLQQQRIEAQCRVSVLLAQVERLKDWKPKVGDRVRLKTVPDAGVCEIWQERVATKEFYIGQENGHHIGWRYVAELMPEEP